MQNRRNFITASGGAIIFSLMPFNKIFPQSPDNMQAFLVNANEDDFFIHGNAKAILCIDKYKHKADDVSLCKWEMDLNGAMPIHRHMVETEIIFIKDGSCTFTLDDKQYQAQKGDAIYIPKTIWHGFTTDPAVVVYGVHYLPVLW